MQIHVTSCVKLRWAMELYISWYLAFGVLLLVAATLLKMVSDCTDSYQFDLTTKQMLLPDAVLTIFPLSKKAKVSQKRIRLSLSRIVLT